jgi:hypothetical protein
MKSFTETQLARLITLGLFAAVMAASFDAWWHGAIGRDSFWEPPHLFLYSAVIVTILAGAYGWKQYKNKLWKRLAWVLVLIPAAAPFDELWHQAFGIEDLSSPFIVWSPPHVVLILALLGSLLALLPILSKDKDPNGRRIFSAMAIAAAAHLSIFLFAPLYPTGGWDLIGFYGAGVISFILISAYLLASKYVMGLGGVTVTALFLIALQLFGIGETLAPDVVVMPHDHPPTWLAIIALLFPAAAIDVMKDHPKPFQGLVSGFIWGALLFGLSSFFFEAAFVYSVENAIIAVVASSIGGYVAGVFIARVSEK